MPGFDQVRGDDEGRTADAAGGVHAQHRLARAAERVGEEQLGHDHALEGVGGLADHDRVDVGPGAARRRRARAVAASRTRPRIETSSRTFLWCVWPTPTTAQRSCTHHSPSKQSNEIVLQSLAARGVGERRVRRSVRDSIARLRAMRTRPSAMTGLAHERAARRVDARCRSGSPSASRRMISCGLNVARQLGDVERSAV